jgi:hypothetical protein
LYNPNFTEYESYFPHIIHNDFLGNPIKTRFTNIKLVNKVISLYLSILKSLCEKYNKRILNYEILNIEQYDADERKYNLTSLEFVRKAKEGNIFVQGWNYRDHDNFIKHSDAIRKIFTPDQYHIDNVSSFIKSARKCVDRLVGVHIRKGDYDKFFGGAYYYDWEDYVVYIRQITHHEPACNIRFLLCSNESIPLEYFKGLNVIVSEGDSIQDILVLSRCDYIIGPPSTFSMWASFYGEAPLIILENRKAQINLKYASQIVSIDHFLDGRVFRHSVS